MKIVIMPELEHGKANELREYLADKNFFQHGRTFLSKTGASEAGKFLLLPENVECIKIIKFGSDRYYVELPILHSWLSEVYYPDPEKGDVLNKDHYDVKTSLDGSKALIKLTEENWRELFELNCFIFDQENDIYNVYANSKAEIHKNEYYTEVQSEPIS